MQKELFMIEFLVANENTLYSFSLCLMLFIALLEGVGVLLGLSLFSAIDNMLALDVDAEINVESPGGLTAILGWLCISRLPFLIWLVLFLTTFALTGLSVNFVSVSIAGVMLPTIIGNLLSLTATVFLVKFIGSKLADALPKNETSAVSSDSFTGAIAKITLGKASINNPTEAVLTDQFNQKHYLLVAPERDTDTFIQGDQVVLTRKEQSTWLAIPFTQNI